MKQKWTAFITGGSEGIGYACAVTLVKHGHQVCIVSRDPIKLEDARNRLSSGNASDILAVSADVTNKEDIKNAVAKANNHFGSIDVLINSAGCSMHAPVPLETVSQEEYARIMHTNVDGTFYTTQAVLEIMRRQNNGYIINILSTAAYKVGARGAPYGASKFAARAITESLVEECRGSGIRVSSISPGPVATSIWSHKTTPPTAEKMEKMLCPEEIADLAMFLLERPPNVFIKDLEVTPWFYSK